MKLLQRLFHDIHNRIYTFLCHDEHLFKFAKMLLLPFLKTRETVIYLTTPPSRRVALCGWLRLHGGKVEKNNYGDDINYLIINKLSGGVINWRLLWLKSRIENLMCIGSILQFPQLKNEESIVWGTGAMYQNAPIVIKPRKVAAVRGPLTRKLLMDAGIDCPEVYGDPALLLPRLYKPVSNEKKYLIGFIPHIYDFHDTILCKLIKLMKGNCCVIDLKEYSSFESVIDLIVSCQYVVSSSLHGLIISDAYNVPNLWVEFSDKVAGGGFKFRDYFLSVGRKETSAYRITDKTEIEDLLKEVEKWVPIHFDADALIKAYPYKIKEGVLA